MQILKRVSVQKRFYVKIPVLDDQVFLSLIPSMFTNFHNLLNTAIQSQVQIQSHLSYIPQYLVVILFMDLFYKPLKSLFRGRVSDHCFNSWHLGIIFMEVSMCYVNSRKIFHCLECHPTMFNDCEFMLPQFETFVEAVFLMVVSITGIWVLLFTEVPSCQE